MLFLLNIKENQLGHVLLLLLELSWEALGRDYWGTIIKPAPYHSCS